MKKLEELGISKWPWHKDCSTGYATPRTGVWDALNFGKGSHQVHKPMHGDDAFGCYTCGDTCAEHLANAYLIAAAPDLYECLREAVEEMCHMTCEDTMDKCTKPESVCFVAKWRKALAKASGESEVK